MPSHRKQRYLCGFVHHRKCLSTLSTTLMILQDGCGGDRAGARSEQQSVVQSPAQQVKDHSKGPMAGVLTLLLLCHCLPGLDKAGYCHWTWLPSADKSSRINQSSFFRAVSSWVLSSSRQGAPHVSGKSVLMLDHSQEKLFPAPSQNVLYCSFCSLPFVPSLARVEAPSSFLPPIRHLCLPFSRLNSPGSLVLSFFARCSNPSHISAFYSIWALFIQHCSSASHSPLQVQDFAELRGSSCLFLQPVRVPLLGSTTL